MKEEMKPNILILSHLWQKSIAIHFFKPLTRGSMPTEVRKCCFKLMPENKGLRIALQKPKWLMKFGRRFLWACVGQLGQQTSKFPKTEAKISSLHHHIWGKAHFLLNLWGWGWEGGWSWWIFQPKEGSVVEYKKKVDINKTRHSRFFCPAWRSPRSVTDYWI